MFVESQILTDVIFNHIIERPLLKPTPVKKKSAFPTSGVKKENAAGYACKGDLNHSYR